MLNFHRLPGCRFTRTSERRARAIRIAALLSLLVAVGCGEQAPPAPGPTVRARALVAADRSGHFLDRPFPSDELLTANGTVDLSSFPKAGPELGRKFLGGWTKQIAADVFGFSALSTIYFRFDAPLAVAGRYESKEGDAIVLRSLDSEDRVPVNVRFVASADGDPYLRDGLLVIMPDETHPLRSGERYLAMVSTRVADLAAGWTPPAEAKDACVASVFTVQNHRRDLATLRDAADAFIDAHPGLLVPGAPLRTVTSLRYEQGMTPNMKVATVETVSFEDGGTETTYLTKDAAATDRTIDVRSGPYAVYQAEVGTAAFQDPKGRPYSSPGVGFINDWQRTDGWIHFDKQGTLLDAAHAESMRVLIQVPRDGQGPHPVVLWSHGSGGDACEAINRVDQADRILDIRATLAGAGAIVVSWDMPIFGRRFPLIEDGYSGDQAYINPGNLIAFRDTPRQAAIDLHTLHRFVTEVLPGLLGDGSVDTQRVGAFGHSTGSQVSVVAAATVAPGTGPSRLLLSGAGGFIANYMVASDLLALGDTADLLFMVAGVAKPDLVTPQSILGALFGVPATGWADFDRHHPLFIPFQTAIDGSDPLAVADVVTVPATVFIGAGDQRVPAASARWLAAAFPNGTLVPCTPTSDYDGHYCALREPAALETFRHFVESL